MITNWELAALADEIVAKAPPAGVKRLCLALETGKMPAARRAMGDMPEACRPAVAKLLQADPELLRIGAVLAGAARTARRLDADTDKISIIWSGGINTVSVANRSTRSTIYWLINTATEHLTLATYTAGNVADLVAALKKRRDDDNLDIRLILETANPKSSNGIKSAEAFGGHANFINHVTALVWARPRPHGEHAAMHMKVLIRDRDAALITSANFSNNAMDNNLELGVLIQGPRIPGLLRDHLDEVADHPQMTAFP